MAALQGKGEQPPVDIAVMGEMVAESLPQAELLQLNATVASIGVEALTKHGVCPEVGEQRRKQQPHHFRPTSPLTAHSPDRLTPSRLSPIHPLAPHQVDEQRLKELATSSCPAPEVSACKSSIDLCRLLIGKGIGLPLLATPGSDALAAQLYT